MPKTTKTEEKERASLSEKKKDAALGISKFKSNRASRNGIYFFGVLMFCVPFSLVVGICYVGNMLTVWAILAGIVLGILTISSIRIVQHWERAVVLRLGKFSRLAGPGIFVIIPIIESVTICVDQRIIATPFQAEETITSDLVSVDIDAVLFWMVWNARMACVEVENYPRAVAWSAQTALRDAVGRVSIAELATRRKQIDTQLQEILATKTEPWGITILSVEIRDITIPSELQNAMSKEAQAERERNARVLLAEIEKDISEMFVEAAEVYDKNDRAMQLRTMNLIYESVRENGGLVVAPSAFSEGFNNIDDFVKTRLKP